MADSENVVDACQRYLRKIPSDSFFDNQAIREHISVALIDQPTLDAHITSVNSMATQRNHSDFTKSKDSPFTDSQMDHIVQNGLGDIENTELARLALSSVALIKLSKRIENEISTPPSHSNLHNHWVQTLSDSTDRALDKEQDSYNEKLDQARADNMFQVMLPDGKIRGR